MSVSAQPTMGLTLWQKTTYSFGTIGHAMLDRALLMWVIVYYVPADQTRSQLLHPAVFAGIMMFGRVVDTLADPLIAKWSDSSHSRFGRRTVFMLWSGLPLVICGVLAFYPPFVPPETAAQERMNAGYLALVMGGYFFFFTAYAAPYLALFPEIVTSFRERVTLGTWRAYFALLALIGGMILSPVLVERLGYRGMIWAMGIPSLLCLYLPFAGINERRLCNSVPSSTPLVRSLLTTLRNGPFVWWLVARQTFDFGFNMIVLAVPYYTALVLGKDEGYVGALLAGTFALTFLSMHPVGALAKRIGKKRTMMLSMGTYVFLLPMFSMTDAAWNPIPPVVWAHLCLGLSGIPLAASLILAEPFIAAVSDLDRDATGQERQAMYFGAQGFFSKVLIGVSGAIALYVMSDFGRALNADGAPTPVRDGVFWLGPIAGLFCLVGLWLFRNYPEKRDPVTGGFYLDYDTARMVAYSGGGAPASPDAEP